MKIERLKCYIVWMLIIVMCISVLALGCNRRKQPSETGDHVDQIQPSKEQIEEPNIKVYLHDVGRVEQMALEEYLKGVVAGEMKNDWPENALGAQAILARTFTLEVMKRKKGQFPQGADISTDIKEAQAYDASAINDNVTKAVAKTRGVIVTYNNDYVHAWFHAASGGKTATPPEGLDYKEEKVPYLVSVNSDEKDAPEDVKSWTATFTKEAVRTAFAKAGADVKTVKTIEISEKGPSGRATELMVNNKKVSGPEFRIALDSRKLKSMLLTDIKFTGNQVVFSGKGYGHGVGMPQWGAYTLAKEGKTPQEIIAHYFKDVIIEKHWE